MYAAGEDTINSLVLLAIVSQDEIFEGHFHSNPLLISEGRPDVMRLSNGGLIRFQDDLGPVSVHVQSSQYQNEAGESLRMAHSDNLHTSSKAATHCV